MQVSAAPETDQQFQPVHGNERISVLDILRGFALFGILTVNMYLFSHPLQVYYQGIGSHGDVPIDGVADWLIAFFTTGKFYTLFSFLFGLGFAIMMLRARERGQSFGPVYARRLLALLAFGLIHAVFIWVGDILVLYALLGWALLLFNLAKKPRTLLIWVVVLFILPLLVYGLGYGALALARLDPAVAAEIERGLAEGEAPIQAEIDRAYTIYGQGNYLEITAQRWSELTSTVWPFSLFMAPSVLMMFLIGAYFGRREIFRDIAAHTRLFRRLLIWGLVIGIPANLAYAFLAGGSTTTIDGLLNLMAASAALHIGGPALSLAYMSAIVLLCANQGARNALNVLAPVGQMGLSNYLLQSIICTLIFYGYGLGLFGQVGSAGGLLIAIAVYLAQIPLSHLWMRRFRSGPAEWLWRSLTYLRPQPLRRSLAPAPRPIEA